ncbi:MAG: hypothetical protein OGMRLDGQ_003344 [Candidatus Fervidibacter sp.]
MRHRIQLLFAATALTFWFSWTPLTVSFAFSQQPLPSLQQEGQPPEQPPAPPEPPEGPQQPEQPQPPEQPEGQPQQPEQPQPPQQPEQPGQPQQPTQPQQPPQPPTLPGPVRREGRVFREGRGVMVELNFVRAEISAVLEFYSKATGKIFVPHPNLDGTITLIAPFRLSIDEAMQVLAAALEVRGFTLMPEGDRIVKIVPISEARQKAVETFFGDVRKPFVPPSQLVTQVFELRYLNARQIQAELQPLLSAQNALIASTSIGNLLIVTDTQANIERISQLLKLMDIDLSAKVDIAIVPLQYADAQQVAQTLGTLLAPFGVVVGAAPRAAAPAPPGQPGAPAAPTTAVTTASIHIVPFTHNNSLLIWAPSFFFAGIPFEQRVLGQQQWMGFQQNVIVADPRRNAVIVTTTDANMPIFEQLIAELDQPADLGRLVKTYRVQNVDAQSLAQTITTILQQQRRPTGFLFFTLAGDTQRLGPLQNLQDVTVTADNRTNTIVVTAPPAAFSAIEALIEQLDQPQPQVFIEVLIVDVTLTKDLQFGVEWHITQKNIFGETNEVTTELITGTEATKQAGGQGLWWGYVSDTFRATLQALARDQKVRVLATPHILAMANVQAQIQIGQQYPVVTSFFPGTVGTPPQISVDLRSIATTLQVTPRVNNAGYITMDIVQTIDDIGGTVVQAGFTQPIINTRVARTSVMVKDGETVVIGGFMRDRIEEIVTGLPVLKDLPVLGHLFRRTEKAKSRTELMVFLTPRIVRTPDELRKLLEEERKRSKYAPPLDQMGQGARDKGQEKGKSDAIVQPGQKQPEQKQPEQSK